MRNRDAHPIDGPTDADLLELNAIFSPIKAKHPALAPFETLKEANSFVNDPSVRSRQKDPILLALLTEYQTNRDGGVLLLLTTVMHPMLEEVYRTESGGKRGTFRQFFAKAKELAFPVTATSKVHPS